MTAVLVAAMIAVAGVGAATLWGRARGRASGPAGDDDARLRRARADTYLRTLSWLDDIRLVHEPPRRSNGHDPVPAELRLKCELATIHELIATFASARVRTMFTTFANSIESRPLGEPIGEAQRYQLIDLAMTMAGEIDTTTPIRRLRRGRASNR